LFVLLPSRFHENMNDNMQDLFTNEQRGGRHRRGSASSRCPVAGGCVLTASLLRGGGGTSPTARISTEGIRKFNYKELTILRGILQPLSAVNNSEVVPCTATVRDSCTRVSRCDGK
jgi:hypothetical protein